MVPELGERPLSGSGAGLTCGITLLQEALALQIASGNVRNFVQATRVHRFRASRAFLATLLAASVLLLEGMAACPSLHELIHKDADSPDHQCAVTLFAHGTVDSAVVDTAMPAPVLFAATFQPVAFQTFAPAIANLPAGRAPPSVSSAS